MSVNVFASVLEWVKEAAAAACGAASAQMAAVTVEQPKDPSHGDLATNAAMVLAGQLKQKPRDLAEAIAETLRGRDGIAAVEIAGPGFINLRFTPAFWQRQLAAIRQAGQGYGDSRVGAGRHVNVEYVSANPTGPMHIGHARGAVFGDALAGLLQKAGFRVTKEYYINDAGAQVDVLARSAYLRYAEALGRHDGTIPEGMYPGEYLKSVGQDLARRHGPALLDLPEADWLAAVKPFAIDAMMAMIRDDLKALAVEHDHFASEKELHDNGKVEEAYRALESKGYIYTGVLEPPKGKTPEDWEPRPQTLFRATDFGDDVDRALKKSDGSWTYFAADIAYHYDKLARGDILIDVLGADHGGYVKRMKAAVKALTDGRSALDIKIVQLVNLTENGVPVKMSKRSGTFVTLREVVDEVGKDVVRFIMLTRKNDAPLDFDLAKVLEQSRENPVFYVQYAHARACSVLRNAAEAGIAAPEGARDADPALLVHERELALIRLLCHWPRIVEAAAEAFEPHRIAFYLQELAAEFHGFWNLGKEAIDLRFIVIDNPELTRARLMLVQAVAQVVASGLSTLGVTPLEEMR